MAKASEKKPSAAKKRLTPKQRVLRKWPGAAWCKCGCGGVADNASSAWPRAYLGSDWADAARRLK